MKKVISVVIYLALAGCATLPECTENYSTKISDDQSRIVIYRIKQFVGSASPGNIYLNDCKAKVIQANHIVEFYLNPGQYEIGYFDFMFGKTGRKILSVSPGREIYVRIHHIADGGANPPVFNIVSREKALKDKIDGIEEFIRKEAESNE